MSDDLVPPPPPTPAPGANFHTIQVFCDIDKGITRIAKPMEVPLPVSAEEFAEVAKLDMAILCEAVCTMFHILEKNGIRSSADSLRTAITHLKLGFADPGYSTRFNPQPQSGAPVEGTKDENVRESLQKIASNINEALPAGWGFFLMTFPFEDAPGRMNYISNAKREDIVKLMQEFISKQTPENFATHA